MSDEQFKVLLIGIFAFVVVIISFCINKIVGICCWVLYAIAGGLLLYFRRNRETNMSEQLISQDNDSEIKAVQFVSLQDFNSLKKSVEKISSEMSAQKQTIERQQEQYNALQSTLKQISTTLSEQRIPLEKREAQESTEIQAIPLIIYPQVFYSQGVDSHTPLGFSVNKLYKQSDKCIFAITINNATEATYSFIKGKDVQDAAISMFNPVISESSEYDSIPAHISEIRVVQPGILRLSGEVWHIINKQKIQMA